MVRSRSLWLLLGLLVLPAFAWPAPEVPAAESSAAVRHIVLDASLPADGDEAARNVKEIRLFFSGEPLLRGASVRIVTSSRSLVRSSPPAIDAKDPKQLYVEIPTALAPGAYVVQWRCIADDGHVMRGDFRFEVAA